MSQERRPPGLGPHLVGQRVVVRRIVPGERGPSGGPALTDLLGVMETWERGQTSVRSETGAVTSIAISDIVSGKPVPPRRSPRQRITPADAERRALDGWPAPVSRPLGEWTLRAASGFSARANSVLAVGDPGMPLEQALGTVQAFYAAQGRPAWAQVVVDSPEHAALAAAGWVPARPGEADTLFQIAPVAQATRAVRRALPPDPPPVQLDRTLQVAWLADDPRARSDLDAARAVLEGPEHVAFASVTGAGARDPDLVVAKGRAAYQDDWVGLSTIWVASQHRRRGLARVVVRALLEWGAQGGATTAYLQTRADNPPALALYDRLGFVTHHAFRYLTPPT